MEQTSKKPLSPSTPRPSDHSPAHPPDHPVDEKRANGKIAPLKARQTEIRRLVEAKGFVTIDHLAREFNVTPQTIRRDINTLSKRGLIHRYHGGAGADSSTENVAYTERKVLCYKEKQKIAKMVAAQIPDQASLFINIGTTTEAIAHAL